MRLTLNRMMMYSFDGYRLREIIDRLRNAKRQEKPLAGGMGIVNVLATIPDRCAKRLSDRAASASGATFAIRERTSASHVNIVITLRSDRCRF